MLIFQAYSVESTRPCWLLSADVFIVIPVERGNLTVNVPAADPKLQFTRGMHSLCGIRFVLSLYPNEFFF